MNRMDIQELKRKSRSELISIIDQMNSDIMALETENRFEKAKAFALSTITSSSSVQDFFHSLLLGFPIRPNSSLRMVMVEKDLFNHPVVDGVGLNHESFQYLDDQVRDQLGGKSVLVMEDTSRVHNILFDPEKIYPRSIYAFPIIFLENKVGFVWVADPEINAYTDQDLNQLKRIISEFEWALAFFVQLQKMKQAESVCTAALNSLDHPVLLCDANGEIIFYNQSACREFSLDQARGKDDATLTKLNESLSLLPKSVSLQVNNVQFEGTKFTLDMPNLGNSFLYLFRNITQDKKSERYLAAIINAIIADISRRLEAIKGFASLVSSLGELSPKQAEYMKAIDEESNQIINKTTRLLDSNRLKTDGFLNLTSVNITDLIRDTVPQFLPIVEQKQLKLRLDLGEDNTQIETDADMFEQLILNLLESATQDAKIGSEIIVEALVNDNTVILRFADKSAGLSRPDIEAILLDQVGVADIYRNLYNARIITELLLGTIDIESQLGEGKKVNISIEQNI